ncbi:siderophore-interacting protein [Rhodococcoides yunnanense]|uniref:siderophore-interacting protein n=1 Tax=Rhodococcoides yunnanense TaxID=278209 RepID=UPI0009344838|nr:siderophore-interacting protein [Rhodococcus yunnanensis]
MSNSSWRGYLYAEVVSVQRLTPHMVRVVFGGPDMANYVPSGAPDECMAVFFPREGEERPPAMTADADGVWWYHGIADQPESRNYSVRRFDRDAGRLVIDFVAHEGGLAATWALEARPGQVLLLAGARSWYDKPEAAEWQLLVADMTGLPSLGRIVEELPAGARAHAIVEVLEPSDVQQFETRGDVTYDWRVGTGNGDSESVLAEAVRGYPLPDGDGYVWFAGEASVTRAVRKYFRKELDYSQERFEIIGYWRAQAERWLEKYKKHESSALAAYNEVIDSGGSEFEADEQYDELLEGVGL